MKCLAIIPARGGSKRIRRKNIRDFLGKPIIYYSIHAAVQTKLFDEIMVSTDDTEISTIANDFGASVPFLRSSKNADDKATTASVILEVLDEYSQRGFYFDYACCIYATAALVKESSIKSSFEMLVERSFCTVFPVVAFGNPIWRSLIVKDGKVSMNWPEYRDTRSQDLPKSWYDAGQFYWINVPAFLKDPFLYNNNSGVIELSALEVQDIDTLEDWRLAEYKAGLS